MRISHRARDRDVRQGIGQPGSHANVRQRRIAAFPAVVLDPECLPARCVVVPSAEPEACLSGAIAAIERELPAGLRQRARHEVSGDAHALVRKVNPRAGVGKTAQQFRVRQMDAGAFEDRQRGGMDGVDLGVGQDARKHGRFS